MACRSHTGGQKYCTPSSLAGPARAAAARGIRRLLRFQGAFFLLFQSKPGHWGHAALPPILWGAGPLQGKSGSGQERRLRARRLLPAGSGILPLCQDAPLPCRRERRWQEGLLPPAAAGQLSPAPAGSTGRPCRSRPAGRPHTKRAPEDRGPCRRWSVRPSSLRCTR